MYSTYMLKSRWSRPAWRNPAVTSRHSSPSATSGPNSAPRATSSLPPKLPPAALAPLNISPSMTTTLIPMRT
jgi:hypothetical protein